MNRLEYPFDHEWHVSINKAADVLRDKGEKHPHYMYEAKTMADEVPRMIMIFKDEREKKLPQKHQQCSKQELEEIKNNHLSCCLGVKCSECPSLLALESIERVKPEDIDTAKAWTCAAHIVSRGGDTMGEGYLMTVGDRMYWDNVYSSLANQ
jgi:hypothetical protein